MRRIALRNLIDTPFASPCYHRFHRDREDGGAATDLLDKAVYEIGYELNNLPATGSFCLRDQTLFEICLNFQPKMNG